MNTKQPTTKERQNWTLAARLCKDEWPALAATLQAGAEAHEIPAKQHDYTAGVYSIIKSLFALNWCPA